MCSYRRKMKLPALAGAVLFSGVLAVAQQAEGQNRNPAPGAAPAQADQSQNPQPGQRRQERRPEGAAESTPHPSADSSLAACLIIDNNMEISMAQQAQQHAQHEKVKAFAEKMEQDHRQFVQQLQEIASQGGYTDQQLSLQDRSSGAQRETAAQRDGARRDDGAAQTRRDNSAQSRTDGAADRRSARPAELENASGQGVDFINLKREVAELCLQSAEQDMASGQDFDKHYIGMQIMAHQGMVSTLTVFERHASAELKQTLQQGRETAQAHLDEARQIMEELKGSTAAAQRGRTSNN